MGQEIRQVHTEWWVAALSSLSLMRTLLVIRSLGAAASMMESTKGGPWRTARNENYAFAHKFGNCEIP